TVNLTIFNRREEIAIMKMVGARNGFVRFPFIIEGLILGIAGALLALLVQWGLYTYVATTALGALEAFKLISFGDMVWQLLAVFIAVGAIVGSVGSALTMRKFLKV
ncbi:MAG: FtsX-like permease family protein, partial [Clostridia bacterium]